MSCQCFLILYTLTVFYFSLLLKHCYVRVCVIILILTVWQTLLIIGERAYY